MYLYKGIGDMPIFNFDIVYRENDLKYMVVGYNGYDEIEIPKGANEAWQKIRNEWIKALDDNTIAYKYQLALEVTYLQTRYNVVKELLHLMFVSDLDEEQIKVYAGMLAQWKYKWNFKAKKLVEIERLLGQLKVSQNKITSKLSELERLCKDEDASDIVSLERQAVILAITTGVNNIDIKTTSVKKWLEISKVATEINEERKRHGK